MPRPSRIRFEVEKPLGKLSKWLRMLGFDASYQGDAGWRKEKNAEFPRIRLTRNRKPLQTETAGMLIAIESDCYLEQLRQVIDATGIQHALLHPFSRCLRCNVPIRTITKDLARARVPDYIWQSQNDFTACPRCGRIYWPGTHAERAIRVIEELFGSDKHRGFDDHDQFEEH